MIIDQYRIVRGRGVAGALTIAAMAIFLAVSATSAMAQEDEEAVDAAAGQDDVSKAMDSTATQWSFQLAYQSMTWKEDTLDNGQPRAPGLDNYVQLRLVIPVALKSFTILPRVTLRHYENLRTGDTGLGNTEIFALIIPKSWDWGNGRFGIGPLVTLPGDEQVARDEWGYGLAGAVVNSKGKWFYGVLVTQSWRAIDPAALPTGSSETNSLGIAPIVNYQLGGGWYVGNGDMIANYDWDSKKFYLPIGVRLGKVFVKEKGTWNFYAEYQTSLFYDDWPGSAVDTSIRVNVTYTIPMG
jgi:hypothetical protein